MITIRKPRKLGGHLRRGTAPTGALAQQAAERQHSAAWFAGYAHGLRDGRTIAAPGATLAQRELVAGTYLRAIGPFPDPYLLGYADGVDAAAVAAGFGEPTDEEIDRFYSDL